MKVLLFANTDWYLYNFRLSLAKTIRERGMEVVLVSPPGPYVKLLEENGFRWVRLEMNRRSVNPVTELATIWRLIRVYRAEKPDLVHHFTIKSVLYGSVAAKFTAIPAIVNAVAGLGYIFSSSSLYARILRPFVRAMLRYSLGGRNTRLIVQNPDDQFMFLKQRLVTPEHVHLIKGSGVDIGRFLPIQRQSSETIRVLLATRLLWDKGVKEYVDAARVLTSSCEEAEFLIAGEPDDGNPAAVQQRNIDEWSAEHVIKALGHVDDMRALLQSVDIVVLPTNYGEGVPRILLEAAATGLPMVATDVAGCREIVLDGVTGYLVPPKSHDHLASAIIKLIKNNVLREALGRGARAKAVEEFNEEDVIRHTIDVYRELLATGPN